MMFNMELGRKNGLMDRNMKGYIIMGLSRDRENLLFLMDQFMRESFQTICFMDLEN